MIEDIHKSLFMLVGALVDNRRLDTKDAVEVLETFLGIDIDYVRKKRTRDLPSEQSEL